MRRSALTIIHVFKQIIIFSHSKPIKVLQNIIIAADAFTIVKKNGTSLVIIDIHLIWYECTQK